MVRRPRRARGLKSKAPAPSLDERVLRRLYMELLIAFELILGVVFVVVFWCTNLDLQLARCSRQRQLDPYDDEWSDGSEVNRRLSEMRIRVHG